MSAMVRSLEDSSLTDESPGEVHNLDWDPTSIFYDKDFILVNTLDGGHQERWTLDQ